MRTTSDGDGCRPAVPVDVDRVRRGGEVPRGPTFESVADDAAEIDEGEPVRAAERTASPLVPNRGTIRQFL